MTGAIDATAIGEHVGLLHRLAQPLIGLGMLLIASFGEDPQRHNPKTGKPGDPLAPKIRHFKIGDSDAMIRAVVALAGERHRNVYAPLAVFRPDLRPGGKGYEKDIVAQFGLVGDFDDAEAERWAERLPRPPCYVLETSRARFQPFYLFDHPEKFVDVKPVAERLCAFAKCDFGTKDLSHVWRIPGTPNWPNAKKLAAGRSPEPQPVRVAVPANGELVSLAELAALLPELDLGAPLAARPPSQKRGAADNACAAVPPDVAELKLHLSAALRRRLEGPISGDRSKNLMALIAECCRLGLGDDEIAGLITAHPLGAGEKYVGRSDLGAEIARVRSKLSTAGTVGNRQPTGAAGPIKASTCGGGAGVGNGAGMPPPPPTGPRAADPDAARPTPGPGGGADPAEDDPGELPPPVPPQLPPPPKQYPPDPEPEIFSDEYLALRFSALHHVDWRYVELWKTWLQWDRTRWKKETTLRAFDLARGICRVASSECYDDAKLARTVADASTVSGVERLARADRRHAMTFDQFNPVDWTFNRP